MSSVTEKLATVMAWLAAKAKETEDKRVPCPGSHSHYSSMHPNADITCPHCGESEDTIGKDVRKIVPTKLALECKKLLEEIT